MNSSEWKNCLVKEINKIDEEIIQLKAMKLLKQNELRIVQLFPDNVPSFYHRRIINGIELKNFEEEFQTISKEFANSSSSSEILKLWVANNKHVSSFPDALAKKQVELISRKHNKISDDAIKNSIVVLDRLSDGKWVLQMYNDLVRSAYDGILPLIV